MGNIFSVGRCAQCCVPCDYVPDLLSCTDTGTTAAETDAWLQQEFTLLLNAGLHTDVATIETVQVQFILSNCKYSILDGQFGCPPYACIQIPHQGCYTCNCLG